ncbi:phosphohistidine phosphatase (plasmid) [Bacillus mycoides]|nr:phosphohistidine phosphatase [Bacillus mycoides]
MKKIRIISGIALVITLILLFGLLFLESVVLHLSVIGTA